MPTSHKPIVVVGSINTDLVAGAARLPAAGETVLGSSFQIHPGGKGANQAVAVSRLDYPVQLIGKVGADQFGEQARSGVDISGVEVDAGTSGVAMIAVSPQGDNSIIVVPGANARVSPGFIDAHLEMDTAVHLLEPLEGLAELGVAFRGLPKGKRVGSRLSISAQERDAMPVPCRVDAYADEN